MRPRHLLLAILAALLPFAASRSNEPIVTTQTVELETLNVKGNFQLPKPESWQYARIDGFEILSNAPESVATRLVRDFEKFRQALEMVRPIPVQPIAASTIILCSRGDAFAHFLPDDPPDRNGLVSLFLRDREKLAIVIDLQTLTYEIPAIGSPQELDVSHRRQLYREYARFLLTQSDFPPPPWLLEGTIQMIIDLETYGRVVNYGKLDMTRGAPDAPDPADVDSERTGDEEEDAEEPDEDANTMANYMIRLRTGGALSLWTSDPPYNVALARKTLMPLGEMFAVAADHPAAANPLVNLAWAKQAHAFVHFCKFGAKLQYDHAFETFIARLANEPLSEPLFQQCFHMSYDDMLKKLASHVRYPKHNYRHYKLAKDERLAAPDPEFREAAQTEVGRIKGDAQSLAGLHAKALATLRIAYARGSPDRDLLASLGKAELLDRQTDDARKHLEAATRLGVPLPSAWAALARLRLEEAQAALAAEGNLSAEQTGQVLLPLLKARSFQPPIPETYALMAQAWESSSLQPTSANIDLLGEGLIHFPFDTQLAYRVAQLYLRAGDPPKAAEVVRLALRFAPTPESRAPFESLLPQKQPPPDRHMPLPHQTPMHP